MSEELKSVGLGTYVHHFGTILPNSSNDGFMKKTSVLTLDLTYSCCSLKSCHTTQWGNSSTGPRTRAETMNMSENGHTSSDCHECEAPSTLKRSSALFRKEESVLNTPANSHKDIYKQPIRHTTGTSSYCLFRVEEMFHHLLNVPPVHFSTSALQCETQIHYKPAHLNPGLWLYHSPPSLSDSVPH